MHPSFLRRCPLRALVTLVLSLVLALGATTALAAMQQAVDSVGGLGGMGKDD